MNPLQYKAREEHLIAICVKQKRVDKISHKSKQKFINSKQILWKDNNWKVVALRKMQLDKLSDLLCLTVSHCMPLYRIATHCLIVIALLSRQPRVLRHKSSAKDQWFIFRAKSQLNFNCRTTHPIVIRSVRWLFDTDCHTIIISRCIVTEMNLFFRFMISRIAADMAKLIDSRRSEGHDSFWTIFSRGSEGSIFHDAMQKPV